MLGATLSAQLESDEQKKLMIAVENGNEQLASTLLASGAHRRVRQYGSPRPEVVLASLLADAAGKGRLSMAKLLVRHGAMINTAYGPLLAAISANHPDVAVFLLENGASANSGSRR